MSAWAVTRGWARVPGAAVSGPWARLALADQFDRVIEPVGGDDAGIVAFLFVNDGDQHIAVGADLVGELGEEAGQVRPGGEANSDCIRCQRRCEGCHSLEARIHLSCPALFSSAPDADTRHNYLKLTPGTKRRPIGRIRQGNAKPIAPCAGKHRNIRTLDGSPRPRGTADSGLI